MNYILRELELARYYWQVLQCTSVFSSYMHIKACLLLLCSETPVAQWLRASDSWSEGLGFMDEHDQTESFSEITTLYYGSLFSYCSISLVLW